MGRARTALEQISEVVSRAAQRHGTSRLMVKVGDSAAMAICCQTQDKQVPHMIGGVVVKRTGEFRGWEVYANGREVE